MNKTRSALDIAFHYLSFRPRSEKELTSHLAKKNLTPEEIALAIIRLKELDLINDQKFTSEFVQARSHNKPKGKKALILELKRKGINVENLDIDESQLAIDALNKKRAIKNVEQAKRFLYSRGFSWDVIERTVKNRYNGSNEG